MEEKKTVEISNGKTISMETLLKMDESFNIAHLLGKAIQALDYQSRQENEAGQPQESVPDNGIILEENGPVFASDKYEANIANQMYQLKALFSPDVTAIIKPSALFDMLLTSAEQLGIDKKTFANEWHTVPNAPLSAIAWIIAKKVFAIRHPDDSIRIISLADLPAKDRKAISFAPFDDTDRFFITEACNSVDLDALTNANEIDKGNLERIKQIKASVSLKIPTSKAYWNEPDIAKKGKVLDSDGLPINATSLDVFGDGSKGARVAISDAYGNPITITAFDMAIEAALGQMWQENDNSTFTASAASIYRKCAGLDSGAAVSQNAINKTTESILKLAKSWVYIAYDMQLKKFLSSHKKKSDKTEGFNYKVSVLDGNMLTIERNSDLVVAPNGRIISGNAIFTITSMPMVYKYSSGFRQLMSVNNKYIAGALTKATPENIPFARYIQVQLNVMDSDKKKEGKYNPTLTFETIAKHSTYDISNRAKLRNFQAKVIAYAQNLVTMGQIKEVKNHYKGKKLTGLDFIL